MSCENVQELISPLLDRRFRPASRRMCWRTSKPCRTVRHAARIDAEGACGPPGHEPAPMPADLTANLRVLASHERERQSFAGDVLQPSAVLVRS